VKLLPIEPETQHEASSKPVLRDDPKFASARIAAFQYITVAIFLFLISGFWDLQVRNPEFYNELAERNRIKSLPIIAPRGKILDRDGRVIVDNHLSWSVILSRETLKPEHLRPIADGLHLDYDDLQIQLKRFQSRPKYEPIIIKQELTPADIAFVESHKDPDFFPELELIHAQRRMYPQNGFAAHVIGYTGEISESELDEPEFAKYDTGSVIGKFGLEKQYNDSLMGVDGAVNGKCLELKKRSRARTSRRRSTWTSRPPPSSLSTAAKAPSSHSILATARCWPWPTGPLLIPTSSRCVLSPLIGRSWWIIPTIPC
jgi:penicillin-binding protein 2